MKKLNVTHYKNYFPVKLWKEDLNLLYSEIADHCKTVSIETESHAFDSLKELYRHINSLPIKEITIIGQNPYISVGLKKDSTNLYFISKNYNDDGLFYNIDKLLTKHQSSSKYFVGYFNTIYALVILYILIYLSATHHIKEINILAISYLLIFILIYCYSLYLTQHKHSKIFFKNKNKSNFIERNYDNLLVGLILTLIGAIITYFIK